MWGPKGMAPCGGPGLVGREDCGCSSPPAPDPLPPPDIGGPLGCISVAVEFGVVTIGSSGLGCGTARPPPSRQLATSTHSAKKG